MVDSYLKNKINENLCAFSTCFNSGSKNSKIKKHFETPELYFESYLVTHHTPANKSTEKQLLKNKNLQAYLAWVDENIYEINDVEIKEQIINDWLGHINSTFEYTPESICTTFDELNNILYFCGF